jgi:NAD+ diphosphatase
MDFELRALPIPEKTQPGYWFIFDKDMLLTANNNNKVTIPYFEDITHMNAGFTEGIYLGRLDSHPCFAILCTDSIEPPKEHTFTGIRQLFGVLEDELFWLAARAYHLVNWDRNTRFCGRCGEKTRLQITEHAKACTGCGFLSYPKISPAIIVAITKDDKILLARSNRFTSNFHSVIAGFVEPGENLEECVVREVKEEVGIEVKNIRYFNSQPWPFPDSLMLGFTAEYAGGELQIDPTELNTADWFAVDSLPAIPGNMSIARKLIDNFKQKYQK